MSWHAELEFRVTQGAAVAKGLGRYHHRLVSGAYCGWEAEAHWSRRTRLRLLPLALAHRRKWLLTQLVAEWHRLARRFRAIDSAVDSAVERALSRTPQASPGTDSGTAGSLCGQRL